MQELEYQLVKEDYKNWIHWNVLRNESKKMKIFSVVIYIGFLAILLGGNLAKSKGNLAMLIPTLVMAVMVGVAMFYTTSTSNQERIIWKKSGLKRLERTGEFPVVHFSIGDKGITMSVASESVEKEYRYSELLGILEIERLFLLEAADKTWQFVAKSAFGSQEEQEAFKLMMEEKIEDARLNPEKYAKEEPVAEEEKTEAGTDSGSFGDEEEEETPIQHVDTSHMGKIGRMANIMAAAAAKDGASEATEATEVKEAAEATEEPESGE